MKRFHAFCSSAVCLMLVASGVARAADQDSRLRMVPFDDERVVPVYVEEGYAVQIVLGSNEHIEAAGTGADSHCDDPNAAWCVVAHRGDHDVYINAHRGATRTNLFVQTNLHNYSFDLMTGWSGRHVYRVQFTYPDEILKQAAALRAAQRAQDDRKLLQDRLAQPPAVRNWNYTMQVMPGSDGIAPTMMYDDGRFTYLKFPNNREIPSIYMVSADNSESMVQWHVENDVMIVHRVAKRFVLRDGSAVVGLWNEAYDMDGVPPHDGVTVPGVDRVIKEHVSMPDSTSGSQSVSSAPVAAAQTATDAAATGTNAVADAIAKANAIAKAIANSAAAAGRTAATPLAPLTPLLPAPSGNVGVPTQRNDDSDN
ncbi:TrbG/VirB9 family P-type conjugative transfer protein [Trinickia acidisoli]|uniref:TrbG/VirB9 family P-type conjugative transfer protein n=1 Tax=Trinickia acidisoli TaxID=2767482 RepID=UPI001A8E297A|nr:TrbG/VirB9 family P-type conjugative transfer protein [Trinickia acidisoli]